MGSSAGLRLLGVHITTLLGLATVGSVGVMVLGPYSRAGGLMVIGCLVARSLVRWRRLLGGDGAEQITTLTLAAALHCPAIRAPSSAGPQPRAGSPGW